MRVALVSPLFESVPPRFYGGTERVVYNLCQGLPSHGIEVTLFASRDSRVDRDVDLVPVIDEALRLRRVPVADPIAFNLKMLAAVAERASDFDLIHSHHDYWMLPLTRMTSTPLLSTLHGRLDLPNISEAFGSYPDAYYVSISQSQRIPMPRLKWIRTVHHGIDTNGFKFHGEVGKYLAFLGRITPEKRPEWAIQIAKQSGVPLKIAAKIEGGEGKEYYDRLVKPHVDGRFIEYLGEISEREKSEFLGRALALVFPIDWPEPFGLVMLEALACGTPVLARPCGAASEVLVEGVTGFSHLDLSALAKRVPQVLRLDRRECRRWVEKRFSLKRMVEDYIHVYQHVADFARARSRQRNRGHWAGRDRRDFLHPVQRVADGNS